MQAMSPTMPAARIHPLQMSGKVVTGHAAQLRDADWLALPEPGVAGEPPAGAQLLHRWRVPVDGAAAGLLFLPLDGNPRHGLLGLASAHGAEGLDAIEILERQGRWLVMPERGRALLLVRRALAGGAPALIRRSSIAATPDRRFIFFNALRDGGIVTLVERRQDAGVAVT
jgi:hypothetical protein